MPGYSQAIDQNSIRLARFEALLDGIEATQKNVKTNDAQIDDLNRRLKVLEGQKNG
jgi:polyhydroxyalkanoate synthesis regulator phasin